MEGPPLPAVEVDHMVSNREPLTVVEQQKVRTMDVLSEQ